MVFLAGIGYNYPFIPKYLSLTGKITAGSGGGGYVKTRGWIIGGNKYWFNTELYSEYCYAN
ncbi:MAG: hypothetical protein CM1200mP10_12000 [Candidatus Neomarinimicrobiota bacterium]|nr:MAG: hypothetical protein CM1200mP10_12000 [Candidatus Neomarinimicrobiota bacterium]